MLTTGTRENTFIIEDVRAVRTQRGNINTGYQQEIVHQIGILFRSPMTIVTDTTYLTLASEKREEGRGIFHQVCVQRVSSTGDTHTNWKGLIDAALKGERGRSPTTTIIVIKRGGGMWKEIIIGLVNAERTRMVSTKDQGENELTAIETVAPHQIIGDMNTGVRGTKWKLPLTATKRETRGRGVQVSYGYSCFLVCRLVLSFILKQKATYCPVCSLRLCSSRG